MTRDLKNRLAIYLDGSILLRPLNCLETSEFRCSIMSYNLQDIHSQDSRDSSFKLFVLKSQIDGLVKMY